MPNKMITMNCPSSFRLPTSSFLLRLSTFLLIALTASVASAQIMQLKQLFDGTFWTDGDVFYRSELKGTNVNMAGGTLHEGGYAFGLKCVNAADLNFTLTGGHWSDESENTISFPCNEGALVEVREMQGYTYLVVNNQKNDALYAFRRLEQDESLRTVIEATIRHAYEGQYRVAKSTLSELPVGSQCSITPERLQLGSYANGAYELGYEFESPTNVFVLGKRSFRIHFIGSDQNLRGGVCIYECHYNEEYDGYEDGRCVLVLDRLPGTTVGRWPEASERILLPGEVSIYPRPMVRVLRNEMFARHGYNFGSKDLNQYFSAEQWYERGTAPDHNNRIHFTAAEQVNISMIRNLEGNKSLYMPEFHEPTFDDNSWLSRNPMATRYEIDEIEIMPGTITPFYGAEAPANVTFEWCKAQGSDFSVGLSHEKQSATSEIKSIIFRKHDANLVFPMILIGEGSDLPETTIHVKEGYIWFELKRSNGKCHYYFYNLATHVLSFSDRSAYQNRTAPANADKTWDEIRSEHLSPKTYH